MRLSFAAARAEIFSGGSGQASPKPVDSKRVASGRVSPIWMVMAPFVATVTVGRKWIRYDGRGAPSFVTRPRIADGDAGVLGGEHSVAVRRPTDRLRARARVRRGPCRRAARFGGRR